MQNLAPIIFGLPAAILAVCAAIIPNFIPTTIGIGLEFLRAFFPSLRETEGLHLDPLPIDNKVDAICDIVEQIREQKRQGLTPVPFKEKEPKPKYIKLGEVKIKKGYWKKGQGLKPSPDFQKNKINSPIKAIQK